MLDLRTEQKFDWFWKDAIDASAILCFDDLVLRRRRKVPVRLGGGLVDPAYPDVKQYFLVTFFYPVLDVISS